jgi:cell wall assembly regulator SMI1
MNVIESSWRIIEQFLLKHSSDTYITLAPPATVEEIEKLKAEINLPIPDSLIQSLLIHNGQRDENRWLPFFDYQHLLSCEEIIETYQMMNNLFPNQDIVNYINPQDCKVVKLHYIWNKKWLPIPDANGDGLILDFDPSFLGEKGQVFYRPNSDNPPDKTIAKSYEQWMERICHKLQSGKFDVEDNMIKIKEFTYEW